MDDTIVIGGGLAGLVTANLLADAGRRVTLLEARGRLGGRATTDERDGHLLNQGPHARYRGGAGLAVLRALALEPAGGIPPAAGALGLAAGRLGLLPAAAWSLARTKLLGPADKLEVARLLSGLDRLDPASVADQTAEDWITAAARRPRVRDLLRGLTRLTTYSADLDLLSATVAVGQIQIGLQGVLYADGGWQCLVDRLAARARVAGVRLETGVAVESIMAGAGGDGGAGGGPGGDGGCRVVVTTAAGVRVARSVVVAGLSPSQTARLVGSDDLARRAAAAVAVQAATPPGERPRADGPARRLRSRRLGRPDRLAGRRQPGQRPPGGRGRAGRPGRPPRSGGGDGRPSGGGPPIGPPS